jgi:hypothetical protein
VPKKYRYNGEFSLAVTAHKANFQQGAIVARCHRNQQRTQIFSRQRHEPAPVSGIPRLFRLPGGGWFVPAPV